MKLKKLAKGGQNKPKYNWSTNPNKPKQEIINSENYTFHGSDNQDLDSYLKGTQLLGDVVSFINPLVGRVISAPGDINDIVRNPKDFKNYITPFIPAVSKNGITGAKTLSKVDRFNTFLTGATLFSDLPIEEKKNGGKTNPPIITNDQEEEFSFQREAIVRMNPLVRAYPTQNDNNNLQSVPEGVDRYLQNKAKSNRNFTDVLTERYNFPYAPYAVQKNSVFRKEGHEDPYTDVVYNAFGNEYSNFPEKERNMLADRANELGYGVKNSNFDKKTGKLMGTYADGGFSERKSKSGRVFKYKSYKI